MGRASYLTKKDGRFWFQKRISGSAAGLPSHLRLSLRTSVYREAVERMVRIMRIEQQAAWRADLHQRGQFLLTEINTCNDAGAARNIEELVERHALEMLANRFVTEARAADHPILTDLPDFWPNWKRFCELCVVGENKLVSGSNIEPRSGKGTTASTFVSSSFSRFPTANIESESPCRKRGMALLEELEKAPFTSCRPLPQLAADTRSLLAGFETISTGPINEEVPFQNDVSHAPVSAAKAGQPAPLTGVLSPILDKETQPPIDGQLLLSAVTNEYLRFRRKKAGHNGSKEDAGLVLQFTIDLLGDKPLNAYARADWADLENALIAIPLRKGIPAANATSLFARYKHAEECKEADFQYVSTTRLTNVWYRSLHAFFEWAYKKGHLESNLVYRFDLVTPNNPKPKSRDTWQDEELIKLFSLPLFTGCQSRNRYWTTGLYLYQSDLYWAYLLAFFLGMRASEIGQLRVSDIVESDGVWYIDFTADGDGPRCFKSASARRRMPIPFLLRHLGFLERRDRLIKDHEVSFFPKWKLYHHKKGDRDMFGHHFSKSWQYIKEKFQFERDGLTLHGGRHWRAQLFDEAGYKQRLRNRLLGHAPTTVADSYGARLVTKEEAHTVLANESGIEKRIADILLSAKLQAEFGKLSLIHE